MMVPCQLWFRRFSNNYGVEPEGDHGNSTDRLNKSLHGEKTKWCHGELLACAGGGDNLKRTIGGNGENDVESALCSVRPRNGCLDQRGIH